jgi:hypothetical protein
VPTAWWSSNEVSRAALVLVLLSAPALAATLKATLLVPADDPRASSAPTSATRRPGCRRRADGAGREPIRARRRRQAALGCKPAPPMRRAPRAAEKAGAAVLSPTCRPTGCSPSPMR